MASVKKPAKSSARKPTSVAASARPATAVKRAGEDVPIIAFASVRAWSDWLRANHASSPGVWIKFAKLGSGVDSVTYPQALEIALAWGWIDGQKKSFDATWWLQRFTRRGGKSIWSKINREKAMALIESGAIQPSGLHEVDRAKADGRWEAAYDQQSKATVPTDLAALLAKNPRAKAFFETLDSRNRYAILFRTQTAKKAETRARRIAEFVAMLAKGQKLYP